VTEHFPDLRRIALYARVSTARQAEADLSIPNQIKQGQEYCERRTFRQPFLLLPKVVAVVNLRRLLTGLIAQALLQRIGYGKLTCNCW
jgi:predicted site-specific integrase-resolvase